MRLAVRVKPGAHRDGLWRENGGLFAQIRAVPKDGEANAYLVKFLAGSLRVPKSMVKIVRGNSSSHKLISIDAPEFDLKPVLDSLPPTPQIGLFD